MSFTMSVLDALGPGTVLRGMVRGRALNAWFMIADVEIIEPVGDTEDFAVYLGVATSLSGQNKKIVRVVIDRSDVRIEAVNTTDE